MADLVGGIGEPITRTFRKTTPKSWPHDAMHLAQFNGEPRSWGASCWCKCPKCWNPYARRCVCSLCPCVAERDAAAEAIRLVPLSGVRPARPVKPRQRASQVQPDPHSTPKTKATPRRRTR